MQLPGSRENRAPHCRPASCAPAVSGAEITPGAMEIHRTSSAIKSGKLASRMNKIVQRIVQVIVTVGVLVWVFHDRQMRANIPMVIHKADMHWILVGIASAGVAELANIFRWQIFLRVQKVNVPLARTAMVFMIGVFFNLFLFGTTGGDVVRAAYLCADQKRKKTGVIISVIVDRLIGMLCWSRLVWPSSFFGTNGSAKQARQRP